MACSQTPVMLACDALITLTPQPQMKKTQSKIDALVAAHPHMLTRETLVSASATRCPYPMEALSLGSSSPQAPRAIIVGGIHGNERIGVDVVLAFLHSLLEQAAWDSHLQALLQDIRLVVVPIANPSGYMNGTRSTAAGIDLMRNAPIEARKAHWLVGGQKLSNRLPWFRGTALAPETEALLNRVQLETAQAPLSISVDCHSGFGAVNRIWFPWAHRREPIPHLAEIYALRNLFRRTYPNHIAYRIEPQCQHYMTHGDIWDYLYAKSLASDQGTLLPLTLEMGSWLWVRKNPMQIFNRHGLFNPIVPHRRRRILRQHLVFLNFILTALANRSAWLPGNAERSALASDAQTYWQDHFAEQPTADSTSAKPTTAKS